MGKTFNYSLAIRNLKEEAKNENFESGISNDSSDDGEAVDVDKNEEQLCQELSPIDEPNDYDLVVEI